MAGKNEARIKFTAETTDLTAKVREVNSSMASLRAGLALNEAEFKNTGNAAEYLKNKQKLLQSQLEQNRAKQEALNGKIEAASRIYGENSSEVQQWETKLQKAKTEEEKLKTALDECEDAIENQTAAEERAQSPLEKLKSKIASQRSELDRLKTEYANVALAEGKDSDAAQELKRKIDSLNSELQENEDQLKDVTQATEEAGNAAEDGGIKTTFLGNVFANLASQGASMLIGKLKEAAKAVVDLGKNFTSSMSNVQALSGASASEMAQLEAVAKELGRSTIFSATDVSDAFGYMALAGWDVQDMLSGIDGVLDLAASSQMDLAKASDIVTDYLTAFGLSADDSGKFVDQMAFAMSHSNTTTEQLGEAYKNCAATAGSMGYSVEETTAALMTMANAGVKGGEAGTGLNAIMTRLATDTKGCATALSEYGVEVYDHQGNMNSLSSILNGTAEIWETLTDEQQNNLAKTIAGQSHYSQFQTVMNGLSEAAEQNGQSFNDYTEALANCEGAASDISAIMNDNLAGDLTALGSAAEGLGLQLYEYFEGPLRESTRKATEFINAITDAITPQKTEMESFIEDINNSNKAVRDSLDNVSSITENAQSDVADLEAYKAILLEINGVEEKSEFQKYQVRNAVEELGASIPGLKEAFDEETGALKLTNKELVDMFNNAENLAMQQALIEAETEAQKALANATINKAKADSAAQTAQEKYNQAIGDAPEYAYAYSDALMDLHNDVINAENAQAVANEQYDEAQQALDKTKAALDPLRDQYFGTVEATEEVTEATEEATEATKEMTEADEEAAEAAKKAAEEIEKAYEDMASGIQKSMQSAVSLTEEFNGGAEVSAEQMLTNLQNQKKGIQQWADDMVKLGKLAGNGMSQSLYDYLAEMGPSAANQVRTLVETLEGNTPLFEEISQEWAAALELSDDPSFLAGYTTAGKNAAGQYQEGLESGASGINSSVNKITTEASKGANMSAMTDEAKNASKGVGSSMSEAEESVRKEMSAMRAQIQSDATQMGSYMRQGLSSIPGDVSDTMTKAKGKVTDGMSEMKTAMNTVLTGPTFSINTQAVKTARDNVRGYIENMKNSLNTTLRGPNIQVPHFKMVGAFNAKLGTVPAVITQWYAKGGIFTRPTIFSTPYGNKGVGEAGAEAVLPIDLLEGYIETAMRNNASGNTVNVSMTVDGARDPSEWAVEFAAELLQQMRG